MARVLGGFHSFYLHTHTFIRNRNEPYLPLPSQPQLVLIYRPRRDGTLSRPWCEVAQAEIQTCNLPVANLALYHSATSAYMLAPTHVFEDCRLVAPNSSAVAYVQPRWWTSNLNSDSAQRSQFHCRRSTALEPFTFPFKHGTRRIQTTVKKITC